MMNRGGILQFSMGINGLARSGKNLFFGNSKSLAKKVKKAYIGDEDGIARQFFAQTVKLGTLAVGSSVYMNVDGVKREFLVVHQGLPSSSYDTSCNGTWLLMKEVYSMGNKFGIEKNIYANSNLHSTLNSTFLEKFDENIRGLIKTINIPILADGNTTVATNLSTKLFLLSTNEVGITASDFTFGPTLGSKLDYFLSGTGSMAKEKRLAYMDGVARTWWTRAPRLNTELMMMQVNASGAPVSGMISTGSGGIRPAMVLSTEIIVDADGDILG